MKEWMKPELVEKMVSETQNAQAESENADGPWVQIDGRYLWPGASIVE